MNNLYDVIRYLLENARHPVDEVKQEALKLVDKLAADASVGPKDPADTAQDTPSDTAV